jgi:hypothetical protein
MTHDITFQARRAGLRGQALASSALSESGLVEASVRALRNYLLECDAARVLQLALLRGKPMPVAWSIPSLNELAQRVKDGDTGVSRDGRAVCLSLRGERVVALLGGPSSAWLTRASEWDDFKRS